MSTRIIPEHVDLIVIGAGPVGENVADYAHREGLSVVIVERELVGGECSYWACMPSKALLRAGAALRAAKRVPGAGAEHAELDPLAVLARRDAMVNQWSDDGQAEWLSSAGIDLVRGHARITGEREVTVTTPDGGVRLLRATSAVAVCTGSDAVLPDVRGIAGASPWSSREATSVERIPDSVIVLGGGVVACEMATAYQSLGSAVTLVVRGALLRAQEPFAGELVSAGLRELGATIVHGAPVSVDRGADGRITMELHDGSSLTASELIVATGRAPRTGDLGLESIGLEPGSWLTVDDGLRVDGFDWLYAVGDVNHRALLTHQGKYQGRIAGALIAVRAKGADVDSSPWGPHEAIADRAAVPQVIFTDPEVAAVGLTASAAAEAGIRTRAVDYEIGSVDGARQQADGYRGTARMVIDEDRGVIVGATFVGQDVAELLHSATIAIVGEVPLSRLWHAVPAYPTMSEVWLRLLESSRSEA